MNADTTSSATIMVVDDNPAGRYATSRMLRSANFKVVEASTGQDALDKVRDVDLVVLDVNLPDMSGFDVCRQIRKGLDTARLPVVHLSASFVKEMDKVEGLEAGADAYLTHPVEPPVLIATVNAFLRTRRAESERERLLADANAAREEAERANRVKDEFLATLSHELRTPLNAIVGWTQILRGGDTSPEDVAEGIEAIERNAHAQVQLIADLLDVSRITSGKVRLNVRLIDPAGAVQAALETMAPAVAARQIRIERDLAPDAGPISADPDRLQQIVWNLVNNAIKFTSPRTGVIRVRLARDDAHAVITVADNGKGIKPAFLPFIFERFRQEDPTTKRNQGGLGLGLAIVRHLVEMHGGSVSAHSDGEGKGASFTVRIPITTAQQIREIPAIAEPPATHHPQPATHFAAQPAEATANPGLHGVRILVAEDDPDARTLLKRLLAGSGADVLAVPDADAALDAVNDFHPHVLVSDVGMPDRDGYDLITALRQRGHAPQSLPAIALTAFARSADKSAALDAGFQVHLTKPVDMGELLAAVQRLVGAAKN